MSNFPPQQFINLHGHPVAVTGSLRRRAPRSATVRELKHKGFAAVGYSPQQLQQAKAEHERVAERARLAGSPPVADFDAGAFMRRAAPARIRRTPYSIPQAAQDACDLATRYGWLNCRVEPIITK